MALSPANKRPGLKRIRSALDKRDLEAEQGPAAAVAAFALIGLLTALGGLLSLIRPWTIKTILSQISWSQNQLGAFGALRGLPYYCLTEGEQSDRRVRVHELRNHASNGPDD